jgi:DNA-binding MarR family transcriptional regulator
MNSQTPWLSAEEEHLWRGWLQLNDEITATLQREMQQDAKLSLSDYEVLVFLTDHPEGRLRVLDLARQLAWERSRVSHHLTRMERRGLVERRECAEDGRGAFIAVTEAGRAANERAAPGHVAAVRRLFFDVLDAEEVAALAAVVEKMRARTAQVADPQAPRGEVGPAS